MDKIYHHYTLWEDWKAGFYNNISGDAKKEKIQSVLTMFQSKELTNEYMNKVIETWKYSCEQNFTNESINKVAYLGQAACCIYGSVPSTITMEAWSLLDNKTKERSNNIALNTIKKWKLANKNIQLCLKII